MKNKLLYSLAGGAIVAVIAAMILSGKTDWVSLQQHAEVNAIQKAYADGDISREQARRMLGAVVDNWPAPPDSAFPKE